MRSATLAFATVFAAGLVLLVALGAFDRRAETFTLGVLSTSPAKLVSGAEVCQRPIDPVTPFTGVGLDVGPKGPDVGELQVVVRSAPGGQLRGRGTAATPNLDRRLLAVDVGQVSDEQRISVCLRNTGPDSVDVYGNVAAAHPPSSAYVKSERIEWDASLVFLRPDEASLLSTAGEMAARAALFRGDSIGPGSVWAVVVLLLIALPLLLLRALRAATR
jgi:hypothetical protein